MDLTHLHLMLNHVPLLGVFFGLLLFAYAAWRKSDEIRMAALIAIALSGISVLPVYLTGESAEERVEHLPGVVKDKIEEHETAGKFALASMLITGAVSALAAFQLRKKGRLSKAMNWVVIVISLWALSVISNTALHGGNIRHTELSQPPPAEND